jgi:endonuclease III
VRSRSEPNTDAKARGRKRPTRKQVRAVCQKLEDAYHSPRHGNPYDPLDDLFFILISNRTGETVANRVYAAARTTFGDWTTLQSQPRRVLEGVLRPAGFAKKRSAQFEGIARALTERFGDVTLSPLAQWNDREAEAFLTTLPGVSNKVAKCVLIYAFGRQLLPVDVHVHRVTRRLGWHAHRRADQSHDTLEALVPPELRYGFHVNCIAHGRNVCVAGLPRCHNCVIRRHCRYFREGKPRSPVKPPSSTVPERQK